MESMGIKIISILEYPELFDAPLIHMENCIVFSGSSDLIVKIKLVLSLEQSVIRKMANQVCFYYDTFLPLCWTAEQVINSPSDQTELYINGEEKSYTQEMKKLI